MNSPSFQHDRLLVAGQVVRPVVHDLNNSLGAAMAYAELAMMEADVSPMVTQHLKEVVSAIERSTQLMGHYAVLARPLYQSQAFHMAETVQGAVDMYMYSLRVLAVRVETDFPDGLPKAEGYPAALQHAILTLLMHSESRLANQEGDRFITLQLTEAEDFIRLAYADSVEEPMSGDRRVPASLENLGLTLESVRHAVERQGGSMEEDGNRVTLALPVATMD